MTICARDHERIAFKATAENVECPACQLVEQVSELQSEIDALNIELHDRETRWAKSY
jgi:hypothetical protein